MKSHEILCTLGPSSMNERVIKRLTDIGVDLFRINLSHAKLEDMAVAIETIRCHTNVPICLDSEGAQVRTGDFRELKYFAHENSLLSIHHEYRLGDGLNLNFYPLSIFDELMVGDLISIDFNAVLVRIVEKNSEAALARVLNEGFVGRNKAVTIEREMTLPPLTEKDKAALAMGRNLGIRHVALSFANRASDIDEVRKYTGPDVRVISKIECNKGLANLVEITQKSDAILIDRGDLSREQPIEKIPLLQKHIITTVKCLGKKVYVATNLLESMVTEPHPSRAEVNDIYNTLSDGADGLVLAAETAIGKYPINCASMISKMIRVYENKRRDFNPHSLFESLGSQLASPHGGSLVCNVLSGNHAEDFGSLRKLSVNKTTLLDCEQIAVGTYSPIDGFMTRDELRSVLDGYALPDGMIWPLPIVLQVRKDQALSFGIGEQIILTDENGDARSLLDIKDIYPFDFHETAPKWFGTTSADHPGALQLKRGGDYFIGGRIRLVKKDVSPFSAYVFTPSQSRLLFEKKGWQKIVGFHASYVVHRAHEYLQLTAMEQCRADGLFISPVIGPGKEGDFLPEPILKSYQLMIDRGFYPKNRVVLGSFSSYIRHAGPRETVFTALCRKNMGCSHFIVARDHAARLDSFHDANSDRALFDKLGDLGITPIFFDPIGYHENTNEYGPIHGTDQTRSITVSQVRDKLKQGERLPDWFIRDEIQELLISAIKSNIPVFY